MRKFFLLWAVTTLGFQFSFAQPPTLGAYPVVTIPAAGGNATVTPSAVPSNATSISAYTNTNFKGLLSVSPVTGLVTITNAHPAGTYTITVQAFNGITTAITSFTLTVNNTRCSQGLFFANPNVTVGISLNAFTIGDFNGDGNQDIAATNASNNNIVSIRLGNGAGGFTGTTNVIVGANLRSVATADFNGDGKLDLAVGNAAGSVSIRLGDGTGNFSGTTEIATGSAPNSLAITDFNNDGRPDFATCNGGNNTVSIRLGDGAGGFSDTTNVPIGSSPFSIATGDFNGDGNADFITANFFSHTVSVRLGNGAGGFNGTTDLNVQGFPISVVVADFNGDAKQDFAVANSGTNTVSIRLGNGAGAFSGTTNTSVGSTPRAVTTGDFNGDGNQDIAAVYTGISSAGMSVRFGNGAGDFSGTSEVGITANPIKLLTGDFNNDGRQDLIALHENNNVVSIRSGSDKEINVQGNTANIPDGDTTAALTDHTDFGNVSGNMSRNFTIQNTGIVNLVVSNIAISGADSSLFTRSGITLPVTIAAGANATFSVSFTPNNIGLKKATIKINNDDCDETLYDFAIQGTGAVPALGTYPDTAIATAGRNARISPSAIPVNATSITAYTSTQFKGVLHVNPATGVLTVTNAHPAGTYLITIKAFNRLGTFTTSFVLTVGNTECSQGLFTGSTTISTGTVPYSIAISDFNGDGNQDIAIANSSSANVSVRLGNGVGGFSGTTNVAVGAAPMAIVAGDFNGDGKFDFATGNYSGSISIRLGDGLGGFTGTTNVPGAGSSQSIAAGDFNGDGRTDFATANYLNAVSICLGDSAGGISTITTLSMADAPLSIAIGDFNNDGKADFAAANPSSSTVSIRLGNGNGSFSGTTNVPVGLRPYSVAIGDFNGDGIADFATANYNNNAVSIRLGNEAGNFTIAGDVAVGTNPASVSIGDFNGDGKQDLAITNNGDNTVSIRLGNGLGAFSSVAGISVGSTPRYVAIGDFNNDGRQDFVTANQNGSSASVRLGGDKEINVLGNNRSITDGDNSPDSTDYTDFGRVVTGDSLVRTFTIQNTGIDTLTITGILLNGVDTTFFVVGGISLPATLPAGTGTTFTIRFSGTGNAVKNARVNILNNDCNESLYDFAIRGVAACLPSTATNVWLGNTADWNLSSNWSLNFVPTECTKVVVNTGVPFMPEITSPVSACYSLTLNNGATITVKTGGHLNITANN